MASLNKWMGIGNLGADPEVRYTGSGDAVANFRIACTEQWKDKDGNKQERTEWVSLVAFKRLAEIIGQYLKKGMQIYVDGQLRTEKWTDKEGQDRYTTKVYIDTMKMLGNRSTGADDGGAKAGGQPGGGGSRAPAKPAQGGGGGGFDDFGGDDIPF